MLFSKSDFLAGAQWDDVCTFDANSRLTLTIASIRNAQARFVVVSGGTSYVSAPFSASQTSVVPANLSWFIWEFGSDPATLKIVSPPSAPTPDFSDITAIGYTVQGSTDLVTWTDISTNAGSVGQTVIFTDTLDLVSGTRRFLRLKVSLP